MGEVEDACTKDELPTMKLEYVNNNLNQTNLPDQAYLTGSLYHPKTTTKRIIIQSREGHLSYISCNVLCSSSPRNKHYDERLPIIVTNVRPTPKLLGVAQICTLL
ncbi:hypothetical protein H4Q26_005730 [Puccinia striiformis f. sp. tritici PST-130]|nr:hypothetical protein H4Q26_005730 [Puccinia striiformis f. sp. tritici PST-130]